MESALKILLLKEDASLEERIEALRRLRQSLQNTVNVLSKIIGQIKSREEELMREIKRTDKDANL